MTSTPPNKSPILLSGSHRSGTTWAGKIFSASKSIGYIMEPFNLLHPRPGLVSLQFDNWFQYIDDTNGPSCMEPVKKMLDFDYDPFTGLRAVRSPKDLARVARDYYHCMKFRQTGARPLVKEPTAVFMAPWFSDTFNADVVLLIRHPAAFISSLLILQWRHPFSHFVRQPALMQEYLQPFAEEIHQYAQKEQALIDQAILLWKIVHHTISLHKKKYPDWSYLRHEDLSLDPMTEFEALFKKLGLDFDDNVRNCIGRYSSSANPSDTTTADLAPQSSHAIRRNSSANIHNWKKRLTDKDIDYIRRHVEDVSKEFYGEKDWNPENEAELQPACNR